MQHPPIRAMLLVGSLFVAACVGDSPNSTGIDASTDVGPTVEAGVDVATSDGASDGSVDSATACDETHAFDTPVLLPGFDAAGQMGTYPRLSPDELTLYFSNTAVADGGFVDGGPFVNEIFSASRSVISAPFGTPVRLPLSVGGEGESDPSSDGLALFYEAASGGYQSLWVSTSGSTLQSFIAGGLVAGIASATPSSDAFPFVSADGGSLYFMSSRDDSLFNLYVAERTGTAYANPMPLAMLNSAARDWTPVVSADGRTIYFTSDRRAPGGPLELWRAHRDSVSDSFPAPAIVTELIDPEDTFPGWLSPDNCRLYLDKDLGHHFASGEMYVATRKP